jgi:hypothetical protein
MFDPQGLTSQHMEDGREIGEDISHTAHTWDIMCVTSSSYVCFLCRPRPGPEPPLDVLGTILSPVDVRNLCTAPVVKRDFRVAAPLTSFTSLTLPGTYLTSLILAGAGVKDKAAGTITIPQHLSKLSPQVRVTIRPLYLRQSHLLYAHSLCTQIWSIVVELDVREQTWLDELLYAFQSLFNMPNLKCLKLTTSGMEPSWNCNSNSLRSNLGDFLAPLILCTSLRELWLPYAFQFDTIEVEPLAFVPQLTLLAINMYQPYWYEGLAGLSSLRKLDISSLSSPGRFVVHVSNNPRLCWNFDKCPGLRLTFGFTYKNELKTI